MIVLALSLGLGALVLSGFVYGHTAIRSYFPFVAELLLILATWFLYRHEKGDLLPLGLAPNFRNIGYLLFGLTIGVAAFFTVTWLRTLYTGNGWQVSTTVDAMLLAKSLYTILPTVMVQELMFRGYLLTKTIRRVGVTRANVVFALLFLLVHVADRQVLQNPAQVISLVICIPIGHLWFATALLRSGTLLFPIGLHWGNNWAVQHLFGNTDNRQTFFFFTHQQSVATWPAFLTLLLLFNLFFLLVTWLTWKGRWPLAARSAS